MKLHFRLIILFLIINGQLMGQSEEPDTIIVSDVSNPSDSIESNLDSISQNLFHPADSLYQATWSRVNITYSSVMLPARRDTLQIILQPSDNSFVSPIKGKVISGFGTARRPGHTGTDIKLNSGDTVRCAFEGQVRLAKRFSGYGNLVLVRHINGLETVYAHLSHINVKENQWLKAGDLIGLGGRTGRATTDHLHFETRLLGEPFNAEKLIDFAEGKLLCDTFYYNRARVEQQLADFRSNKKQPLYAATGETIHYSIKSGDTLSSIAHLFGTSIKNICLLNNITTQKILQIGTKLIIQQ